MFFKLPTPPRQPENRLHHPFKQTSKQTLRPIRRFRLHQSTLIFVNKL
ncbi:hypothetical protein [Kingella sp. (in: b-proteobacteria)]|nr:hypothetical protein [Kingella sp. (in: b-proteobacteria)]MDO4656952.1 hypothetical protein [Kingella sp. (in: b-proteobacteria)]